MFTKDISLVQKDCLCSLEKFRDSLVDKSEKEGGPIFGHGLLYHHNNHKVSDANGAMTSDLIQGIKRGKTIEIRKEEVMAIRNRFPTKIPVIVQRFSKETNLPKLDKSKFLVPQEITMSQFLTIIRNRMRVNSTQALYLLVNDRSMLSLSLTLGEAYSEHAGPDGFLYVTYASQEVFG